MRLCKEHQFISYVDTDNSFYNYPIHFDDIALMPESSQIYQEIEQLESIYKNATFNLTSGSPVLENAAQNYEDFWIRSVGPTLYNKFIDKYSRKMWMLDSNDEIDDFSWSPKGVAIKYGNREGWDTAISAYPRANDGYNSYFDLAASKCDFHIKSTVTAIQPNSLSALIDGTWHQYDLIINTAPLDQLFSNIFGDLKYIGRKIEYIVLPSELVLPENVYFAYYTGSESYTRVVEYKKFTLYDSPHSLISLEYPSLTHGKFYPMPTPHYRSIHKRYTGLCHDKMINVGRIGLYNYRYDIDDVVEQVLDLVSTL